MRPIFVCNLAQCILDSPMNRYYTGGMFGRRHYRRSPVYKRIPIIPGILYINLSSSGISLSFGSASTGRATVNSSGLRLNKSIGGFRIGKSFSFSKIAKLFGFGREKSK